MDFKLFLTRREVEMKINRTLSIALALLLSMGIVCMPQAQNGVKLSDEQDEKVQG
jgi:hypothetical protein